MADAQIDGMTMLYALETQSRQVGREARLDGAENARTERRRLQRELREALREAAEAREKKGKWGKLGKVLGAVARGAAVVGSIAAAVCTAGAATPLVALAVAGAVLSTAGYAVGELKAFEQFPNAEKWALGLSLAGAGLSCGAGLAAGLTGATRALDGVQKGAAVAGTYAQVTGGAAAAGAGAVAIPKHRLEREACEHEADAEAAEVEASRQRWMLERLIEALEQMEETETRTLDSLTDAIEAKQSGNTVAGARWKA